MWGLSPRKLTVYLIACQLSGIVLGLRIGHPELAIPLGPTSVGGVVAKGVVNLFEGVVVILLVFVFGRSLVIRSGNNDV